jgi:cobalt-zinc-cadmium efflux system protein
VSAHDHNHEHPQAPGPAAIKDHGHSHAGGGHEGHAHGVSADADRGKLAIALGLIVGFMVVEVVIGILVKSLALLSDAGHMLTDAAAIGLALVAINLAKRPAKGAYTFGLKRTEILSAQFNGATLLVLALLIIYEGIRRLVDPPDVQGTAVLVVAIVGIVVNLLATYTLSKANRQSLNVEGAYQHILTDLAAFVFTAIAGAVILITGFRRADGIASLIIAAIMLRAAYGLLRESGRVFLEAAPRGLDPDTIGRAMLTTTDVIEIHDLHVWEVASGFPALAAHVTVTAAGDCHEARRNIERTLMADFNLEHTKLQVDHEGNESVELEMDEQRHRTIT